MDFLLDNEIKEELQHELGNDEKLLWTGKPKTGILFRSVDFFLIPFSVIWGGGVFVGFIAALVSKGTPWFLGFFLIPFLAVACYIIFGRFLVDKKRREKTVYGITNNRIIIKSGIFSKSIKSMTIKTITDITFDEKKDKTGDIAFGPIYFKNQMALGFGGFGGKQLSQFERIADARSVYNLIIDLQNKV